MLRFDNLKFIKELNSKTNDFCVDNKFLYFISSVDGNLYVVDLEKNKIIDNVCSGGNFRNVLIYKDEIFMINENSNSIYILDKKTLNPIFLINLENIINLITIKNKNLYAVCEEDIVLINLENKEITNKIKIYHKSLNFIE